MSQSSRLLDSQPTTPKKKSAKARGSGADNGDMGSSLSKGSDHAGSPSMESSQDAAPVGHAPEDEKQSIAERSKYEAAVPFLSRKGDRFS